MQNTSQLADSTVSNISISAPRFLPGYKLVAVLNKPQMFREKKKKNRWQEHISHRASPTGKNYTRQAAKG